MNSSGIQWKVLSGKQMSKQHVSIIHISHRRRYDYCWRGDAVI